MPHKIVRLEAVSEEQGSGLGEISKSGFRTWRAEGDGSFEVVPRASRPRNGLGKRGTTQCRGVAQCCCLGQAEAAETVEGQENANALQETLTRHLV